MRIAVIGLGAMGSALVERLLEDGHELEVWNRSPARAAPFAGRARVLDSPDAASADAVVLTLADDASVLAVAAPDGAPRRSWTGRTVVNTATVAPETVRRMVALYPDRFVAAQILGAPRAVSEGTARWIVGGPTEPVHALGALWAAFTTTDHAGTDPQRAAVLKLLQNQMLLAGIALVAETIRLGRAAGVDDATLTELLRDSPMLPPGIANRVEGFVDPQHTGWFTPPLAAKDLGHALGLDPHSSFPLTTAARDAFGQVGDDGWDAADVTAVVELGHPRKG